MSLYFIAFNRTACWTTWSIDLWKVFLHIKCTRLYLSDYKAGELYLSRLKNIWTPFILIEIEIRPLTIHRSVKVKLYIFWQTIKAIFYCKHRPWKSH